MTADPTTPMSPWREAVEGLFYRVAASGVLPARWFEPRLPPPGERTARSGTLHIEVVSHCWRYGHLLVYQLSSLVNRPPRRARVTATVFYSEEDTDTLRVLRFFGGIEVPGVTWNWQPLPKEFLFRRAIGRNRAALATAADWVWFTDCDLLFRDGCLDHLADRLQGRREALVYPREERRTPLLADDDPMLAAGAEPRVLDIDASQFTAQHPSRATGPLQIAHGDVCRACGYVDAIRFYQHPADHFRKCREDRAFRWLLRTPGTPIEVPGVYRIRHVHKGRYAAPERGSARLRAGIRLLQSRLRDRDAR